MAVIIRKENKNTKEHLCTIRHAIKSSPNLCRLRETFTSLDVDFPLCVVDVWRAAVRLSVHLTPPEKLYILDVSLYAVRRSAEGQTVTSSHDPQKPE